MKAMGKILMKMAVLLKGNGSRGHFLFENPSSVNFQKRNERKREFRAAEMRFHLHKEFCAAEIRFYLHKEYVGAILKKMAIFIKENALRPVENHDMESETAGG